MSNNILVLGGAGMLGHQVVKWLRSEKEYEVYYTINSTNFDQEGIRCDVTKNEELNWVFEKVQPGVVVNGIGALVQESKKAPVNTIYLNSLLPHKLSNLCGSTTKLVHVSTDCVFSGKAGPYSEDDFKDADDLYGRTKAIGEIFHNQHATLRTSIIGPELKSDGEGLFHWFMQQNGEIFGFTKALWSGVTTMEMAKAISSTIMNDLRGLFHVTNGNSISKYDLLSLIQTFMDKDDVTINEYDQVVDDKSLMKSQKYDFGIPPFDAMIKDLADQIRENPGLYPFYFNQSNHL